MRRILLTATLLIAGGLAIAFGPSAAAQRGEQLEQMRRNFTEANDKRLSEPFKGIAAASGVETGLFAVRSTGVSTEPVRRAAAAFLAALTPEQRKKTTFAVDDLEWRKWANQDIYMRQGVSFLEMTEAQREKAFDLLRASLSAKGLKQTRNIMRLNYTLGELNGNNFDRYGELRYHMTVMGDPSATRAVGLAVRRPPRRHQLLRARRPGRDDADVRRLRAGDRPHRQVHRDDDPAGRAEQGLALINALPEAQRAEGDPRGRQDRQQEPHRGVPGQRRPRLRGRAARRSCRRRSASSSSISSRSTSATWTTGTRG